MTEDKDEIVLLVHLDPKAPAHVLGVWFPPASKGGTPQSYYPHASPDASTAADTVLRYAASETWDEVVDRLVARTPYAAWWEAYPIERGGSDVEAFLAAEKAFAEHAASRHGKTFDSPIGKLTVKMLTGVEAAVAGAKTAGEKLAHLAGGPTARFVPSSAPKLSALVEFFADEGRLLVVAPDRDKAADADLALAYGLAWAGDRDLWLVLPDNAAEATRERVAFLDWPVRVCTFDEELQVTVAEPLLHDEVIARFVQDTVTNSAAHTLGERQQWVQSLIDWASTAPGLVPQHRPSYLTWHCAGRQVLRLKRTRHGIAVTAGVAYSKPTSQQQPPFEIEVKAMLDPAAMHRIVAAVAVAAAERLEGGDAGHAEHKFQALLPAWRGQLGLSDVRREVPARRAGGAPAFIDFVGIDSRRRLHAVETKLGNDAMLALQALDYWIWVTANREQLASALFGVDDPHREVVADVVVTAKPGTAESQDLGPYTAAQLEAFDGKIPWRLHRVSGWESDNPVVRSPGRRAVGDAPRCAPARWSIRAQAHLRTHAEAAGTTVTADHRWQPPEAAFSAPAALVFAELTAKKLTHKYASHVRSSQAFALNLFAGLDEAALARVCRSVGVDAVPAGPVEFEFTDPANLLHEGSKASSHTTQVDVVIPTVTDTGERQLLLIEVKLAETDFSPCSAFRSPNNDRRDVCGQPHPFGGDPSACFQLRNHDKGSRREYDTYLGHFAEVPQGHACWFRDGVNQPMRNVALAAALVADGRAERATVALCAPTAHGAMWRRWDEAKGLLSGHPAVALADLPAELVVAHHDAADVAFGLADRYMLDPSIARRRHDRLRWQAQVDAWFPDGGALEVHEPGQEVFHPHLDPRPVVLEAYDDLCLVQVWSDPFQPFEEWIDLGRVHPVDDREGHPTLELRPAPSRRTLVHPSRAGADLTELARRRDTRLLPDFDAQNAIPPPGAELA